MTQAKKEAAQPPALKVSRGKEDPQRIIIYGGNGVGKTSLAANIGKAIMIDCEGGAGHADVDCYEFEGGRRQPKSLDEVYVALRTIISAEHDYTTIVIDGLEELELLIFDKVCKTMTPQKGDTPDDGIDGFGWARGKRASKNDWRELVNALDHLRSRRGMAIVMVGHAAPTTFQNPTGDDYDQYSLNIYKDSRDALYNWADIIGFMEYETHVGAKPKDKESVIATATGARILHLREGSAFKAKCRSEFLIPAKIEIPREQPWAPVSAVLKGDA